MKLKTGFLQRFLILVLMTPIILMASFSARAQNSRFATPTYSQPIMDQADLLDSGLTQKLSAALEAIYQAGGPQIAVLTVDTIGELTIEDASMQVAKAWKLGTAEKDKGILLMIAKQERKIRIEVGQGVEGDLSDAYSRRIIDDVMVPLFKQGNFNDAVVLGVDNILKRMDPPIELKQYIQVRAPKPRGQGDDVGGWVKIFIILFVLFVIFGLGGGRGGGGSGALAGALLGMSMGGSSRGGGGFSGGGGGGFSGGGASGSW